MNKWKRFNMLKYNTLPTARTAKSSRYLGNASQKETELTRHTLAEILKKSGRLGEFKVNPQAFMAAVAKEISRALHDLMTAASTNGMLREVKAFFLWLADQPGYKSRVTHSDADYLTPDRKSEAARRSSCWKPHPSPDQVRHLLRSLPTDTVLQRRNRALIAFLF